MWPAWGGCQNLHTLDLSGCRRLTDVDALGMCTELVTLDLYNCSGLSDISALGRCTKLVALYNVSPFISRGENLHTLVDLTGPHRFAAAAD